MPAFLSFYIWYVKSWDSRFCCISWGHLSHPSDESCDHVRSSSCKEPLVCQDLQLSLGKSYTVTQRICESTRRFGFEYPVSSPESYNEENSFFVCFFYPWVSVHSKVWGLESLQCDHVFKFQTIPFPPSPPTPMYSLMKTTY